MRISTRAKHIQFYSIESIIMQRASIKHTNNAGDDDMNGAGDDDMNGAGDDMEVDVPSIAASDRAWYYSNVHSPTRSGY